MREELLSIIEKNSKIDFSELAVLLGKSEEEVLLELSNLEKEGVICGYHTLINWEKTSIEKVMALIEVKVTPQRGRGFDNIAERIYDYPEVKAVYLISGGYDLLVILEEKSLNANGVGITADDCNIKALNLYKRFGFTYEGEKTFPYAHLNIYGLYF